MEMQDEMYIKGFNHGYTLAKHDPDLMRSLAATTGKGDYLQGLKDGKEQFELEQKKEKDIEAYKARIHKNNEPSKDKEGICN